MEHLQINDHPNRTRPVQIEPAVGQIATSAQGAGRRRCVIGGRCVFFAFFLLFLREDDQVTKLVG
jgi:hypothetical protein